MTVCKVRLLLSALGEEQLYSFPISKCAYSNSLFLSYYYHQFKTFFFSTVGGNWRTWRKPMPIQARALKAPTTNLGVEPVTFLL